MTVKIDSIKIAEMTAERQQQIDTQRRVDDTVLRTYAALDYRTRPVNQLGISHPAAANWSEVVITRDDVKALNVIIDTQAGRQEARDTNPVELEQPVVIAQHGLRFTVLSGWAALMNTYLDGQETFTVILGRLK